MFQPDLPSPGTTRPLCEALEPRLLLDAVDPWQDLTDDPGTPLTPLGAVADAYEVDNSSSQANVISTDGTPQTHSLHTSSDVDWVKFTLSSTSQVWVETDGPAGDTEMWLYVPNSSSTLNSYDDESGAGHFSRITSLLGAGTYYVKVEGYAGSLIDSYTLAVGATAGTGDLYENDDSS